MLWNNKIITKNNENALFLNKSNFKIFQIQVKLTNFLLDMNDLLIESYSTYMKINKKSNKSFFFSFKNYLSKKLNLKIYWLYEFLINI